MTRHLCTFRTPLASGAFASLFAILATHVIGATVSVDASASARTLNRRIMRMESTSELPATASTKPLVSCGTMRGKTPWEWKHRLAMDKICKDEDSKALMEVFLDNRFEQQYKKYYDDDGWVDSAWVSYIKVNNKTGDYFAQQALNMVQSVHLFSEHPVVIVNFGTVVPTELDPKIPRLVVLHARPLKEGDVRFNFNKLRAVFLAKAKTGVSLDGDMIMVGKQGNDLMKRTKEEITEKYPWPMMPTHFLDRDPRDKALKWRGSNFLEYECPHCPDETMRWGQAQPTWTYWSLPFFSRWLGAKLAGREEQGVPTKDILEDEDLLNVALWREGASKAWCMWQPGGVSFIWENLYGHHAPGMWYDDPHYYPHGVPIAWYFAHAEKNLDRVEKALQYFGAGQVDLAHAPKQVFFHDGKFYSTFKELRKADKHLKCMM